MVNPLLYGRVTKVAISVPGGYLSFTNDNLEVQFEVNFDDDEVPNLNTITVYNLTQTTINKIQKNQNVTITAGYKGEFGIICEGKVVSSLTKYSGVDKLTTITFKEGTDYSGVKVTASTADPAQKYFIKKRVKLKVPIKTTTIDKNGHKHTATTRYKTVKEPKYKKQTMQITFKNGTKAIQIISKLTSILGAKPSEISLPVNKVYKSGFKVTGKIEESLVQVVKDCGAALYWRRGKMVIRSIEKGNDERFTLSEETGLIDAPEEFEDDTAKGYTVRCLLQFRITVASIITIKSSTCNGTFRVRRGKHYYDGADFVSEFEVI